MPVYRFYREDGVVEAEPERWRWVAKYTDGTELHQFDDEKGRYHQFREIDKSRLYTFSMVSDNGKSPMVLQMKPGRKPIHFYHRYRRITMGGGDDNQSSSTVYCFGYEEHGHKVIIMIMPDDGIVITDDPDKVQVMI